MPTAHEQPDIDTVFLDRVNAILETDDLPAGTKVDQIVDASKFFEENDADSLTRYPETTFCQHRYPVTRDQDILKAVRMLVDRGPTADNAETLANLVINYHEHGDEELLDDVLRKSDAPTI